MHLSDAHHSRKMLAGTCMVLAPIVLLAALVVHPATHLDEAKQVAAISANLDAWYISHLLGLISLVLVVPALLGLMHMLRERQVAFGHVGGGLALIGVLAYVAIVGMELAMWQMAGAGNTGEAVALLERLNETAGIVIPFGIGAAAFALGMVVLGAGLYRARAAQSWMAVSVGIGGLVLAVGLAVALDWLAIVGAAFLVVGLGSIGGVVLRETDEAWEHTPEYEGFRPVPGMR